VTRGRIVAASVVMAIVSFAVTAIVTVAVRERAARTRPAAPAAAPAAPAPAGPGRKITAHLFYVSADGTKLTGVDREVAYADGALAQAQEIVTAQIAPVTAPLVSAIPAGTQLRAIYLTGKGEAYVDLSKEVATAHTGGTLDELLTVYTIVNALTANLPAVTAVQILVDGKEVDTLVGRIDLRRPLARNPGLVDQ
jgi:spore germination protein GerM